LLLDFFGFSDFEDTLVANTTYFYGLSEIYLGKIDISKRTLKNVELSGVTLMMTT
jgi:hypothetical protein